VRGLGTLLPHRDEDRADDQGRAEADRERDLLAEQRRAQHDRDERVHVLVRDDLLDRRVPEQPGVRREADQRADDAEVEPRGDRRKAEPGRLDGAELAGRGAEDEQEDAGAQHLPGGRDEAVARQRQPVPEERAERPRDARGQHEREPGGARTARDPGDDDQAEPDEPGEDAHAGGDRHPLARQRAEEDHLERHRPGDHRGDARVDPRLGERDHADAEGEQREAEERRGGELAARHPDAPPAQDEDQRQQAAGEQEARARREQRRQRLHGDLDREVRRPPDQVDGPEGGEQLPGSGGGHVYWNERGPPA